MKQRKRQIDPDFFHNEVLGNLDPFARLLFAGLWTIADREGLLKDTPDVIKGLVFPFDKKVNVDNLLKQLSDKGFIVRYSIDGGKYIWIKSFKEHQPVHPNEKQSVIKLPVKQTQGHCGQNVDVEENVDINIKVDVGEEVEEQPKPKFRSKAQRWNDGQYDLISKKFQEHWGREPDIKTEMAIWLKKAQKSVGLVIIGLKRAKAYEKKSEEVIKDITAWICSDFQRRNYWTDTDLAKIKQIDLDYEADYKTKVDAIKIGDIMGREALK